MYLADALSCAFLPYDVIQKTAEEFESVNMVEDIRVKPATLQEIRDHTEQDEVLQELMNVIKTGWPETKHEVSHQLTPFFGIQDKLSMQDGIVLPDEDAFNELIGQMEEEYPDILRKVPSQGQDLVSPRLGLVKHAERTRSVCFSYFQGTTCIFNKFI